MFIDSLVAFGLFFATAIAIVALFLFLYALVTPYDDHKLIFKENNTAAAIGFGGAILGLCIPLYSALTSSASYVDFLVWASIAALIQLLFALFMTRFTGKFSVKEGIVNGEVASGILLAFLSIAIGLLNAGSMSY